MSDRLENEIEHGKYLLAHGAGEVWSWETPAGRIRWARRVEMLTRHLQPGQLVLELGCGTGYFSRELAKTGAHITAIDISPDLLDAARDDCRQDNVSFELENAYRLTYADAMFDSVVGSSVLHHLDLVPALFEIHRVLKPGGTIRFTEPNMLNPQIAVQKNVPSIKRRLGDSPDETAFFRWPLHRRLYESGFCHVRLTPFDFLHPRTPPRWISMARRLGTFAETFPVLREIAGSLYLQAGK